MTVVWRLKTKPKQCNESARIELIEAMLSEGFLASGWHISKVPNTIEEYCEATDAENGAKATVNIKRFVSKLQSGHLVWIVDTSGLYHLAEVTGSWYYCRDNRSFDIHAINRFPCKWIVNGLSAADASSGVRNGLMQGGAFCRVRNEAAVFHTGKLAGHDTGTEGAGFIDLLGHDALEDLVGLYLQEKCNALVVPSSSKQSTVAYEYVLKKRGGDGDVVAQVKSGASEISNNLQHIPADRFLFAISGKYPEELKGAKIIARTELEEFARNNQNLLPNKISIWLT